MMCLQCPVFKECKEYKIKTKSVGGVWAGELDTRDEKGD